MKKSLRMSGFTLVEVLVSVMLTGIILTAAYSAFQGIIKSQVRLSGAMDIQRNLLYLNEKLARIIHNGGTLDYEEYFNRRMLGYTQGPIPVGATDLYTFSQVSKYGNTGTLYLCGKSGDNDGCIGSNAVGAKPTPPAIKVIPSTTLYNRTTPIQQPYRQYRELAFNYGSNLPNPTKLPSIFPSGVITGEPVPTGITKIGIPELYLIKKLPDGSHERVYFRHVLVLDPAIANSQPGATCNPTAPINCLGKLQMTKMVSCDKYTGSIFNKTDGNIDKWIPHPDFSSIPTPLNCSSSTLTDFDNPTNKLVWVDISTPDMNIIRAQFFPNPLKIPTLMAGTGETYPESPTVRIHIEVQLSEIALRRGLLKNEGNPARTIITTFDLSDS